ncbi:MAG: chromosomal replication initiator protein DnaA [Oscillospiraceae bacterium]|nr:chromosomal replication initiator protein DnaA [Oscillospiraceae bacterium]
MSEQNQIWTFVQDKLKEQNPTSVYNIWFAEASLLFLDTEQAIIGVDSNLKKDFIEKKYLKNLREIFSEVIGSIDVYIRSTEHSPATSFPVTTPDPPEEPPPAVISSHDNSILASAGYTFDNFIVGDSNKFAFSAATAVAKSTVSVYNPLFIYGASGLGKTHLLYAIMNQTKARMPQASVIYIKGEEFTNQLIESFALRNSHVFRQKYRAVDMILIDDIQFIAGKESVQEEIFHTFNAFHDAGKQIVLASDRPPRDMKTLENRLRSRFESGVIADVQIPDFELRIAIMKNKAAAIGVTLPNDVLTYLAENLKSNIRQLEGAIKRIGAKSFLGEHTISVALAKECTTDLLIGNEPIAVTIEKIITKVAEKYSVAVDDIKSRKRAKDISNARHVAIYIVRSVIDMSLPAIGKAFGRDHSTVMSSLNVIEKAIESNPSIEMEVNALIMEIREGS